MYRNIGLTDGVDLRHIRNDLRRGPLRRLLRPQKCTHIIMPIVILDRGDGFKDLGRGDIHCLNQPWKKGAAEDGKREDVGVARGGVTEADLGDGVVVVVVVVVVVGGAAAPTAVFDDDHAFVSTAATTPTTIARALISLISSTTTTTTIPSFLSPTTGGSTTSFFISFSPPTGEGTGGDVEVILLLVVEEEGRGG